ncbi:hypothetical protein K491DRAFT_583047, partial [Lophiostoma macrostomum CBS 122681]
RVSQSKILSSFDTLVSQDKIIYDSNQTPTPYSSPSPFHALFIITSTFQQKPSKPSDSLAAEEQEDLAPGSDINIAGLEITDVGERHVLAFNKFPSFRPHLLLLTEDGHVRQQEDLSQADVGALWDRQWVGIFNCGKEGGCSRVHKHMQIFPLPDRKARDKWTLFPSTDPDAAASKDIRVPFRYFIYRFARDRSRDGDSSEAYQAYVKMLRDSREVLGLGGDQYCPHNVVMTRDWMVVIPRRRGQVGGLGVNAASMMGLATVKDEEEFGKWKSAGVERVLEEAGV